MAAPAALATTVVLWASAFAAIREAVRALGWAHLSVLRLAAPPSCSARSPPSGGSAGRRAATCRCWRCAR